MAQLPSNALRPSVIVMCSALSMPVRDRPERGNSDQAISGVDDSGRRREVFLAGGTLGDEVPASWWADQVDAGDARCVE
ncbi:hypothetical protein ABZ770_24250 [Streptomyces sp. NPDC006654]|uniref:hypothetical protein n=1 Tax=Streptomyces sp. NPDC006654 TaxID=3156897 RepID=UPI0033E1DBF0